MADETINCGQYSIFKTEKSGEVWQFRCVRLGGRKIRTSTKETDRTKAEAVAARRFAEILDLEGKPVPAETAKLAAQSPVARATIVDVGAKFLARLEVIARDHRDGYYRNHDIVLTNYLVHLLEFVDEIDFSLDNEGRCSNFLEKLRPLSKDHGGKLRWTTIGKIAITARLLYQHAMSIGVVARLPLPNLQLCLPKNFAKLVKQQQAARRALSEAERDAILEALGKYDPHTNACTLPMGSALRFYTIAFWSLMRKGELQAMTPRWIDFAAKLITIPATDSKSGEVESIPLHARVSAAAAEEIKIREAEDKRDLPIFGPIYFRKAWKFALATARVDDKPIDPHGLTPYHTTRHSGATWAASRTKDGLALQALGRWRSLQMVARYTHASAERARSVLDQF